MVELSEAGVAATTLEGVWRELAPIVNEAKKLEAESAQNPSLLSDPWVILHVRWVNVFGQDLAAVQKVYENTQNGSQLPADTVRAAEEVGRKLLDIILEGRRRFPAPRDQAQLVMEMTSREEQPA